MEKLSELKMCDIAEISFTYGDDVPSVCGIILKNKNEYKFTALTDDAKKKLKDDYDALLGAKNP